MSRVSRRRAGWWVTLLLALAASGLGTAATLPDAGGAWTRLPARYWDDVHLAVAYSLGHGLPTTLSLPDRGREVRKPGDLTEADRVIVDAAQAARIRSWQFWRSFALPDSWAAAVPVPAPVFDDAGRALLLGAAFRRLGGVSPFLIYWLGFLVFVPLIVWLTVELAASGRRVAAGVTAAILGTSAFWTEGLALAYSAIGFYLLTLLLVAILAVYAWLSAEPRPLGYLLRMLAAGASFAGFATSRSGAWGAAPALAWTAIVAGRRSARHLSAPWVLMTTVLGCGVLLAPAAGARLVVKRMVDATSARYGSAGVRPPQHAFWFGVWAGFGDFDRTKGHVWRDSAVFAAIHRAGGTATRLDEVVPEDERRIRTSVLADVRSDPGWFVGILLKRLWATAVQEKLWPWPRLDGRSISPARSRNEGVTDSYYRLTSNADVFRIGRFRAELPMTLIVAPTVLLLAAGPFTARSFNEAVRPHANVLASVALAALPIPVLITTASALETQAFSLVYYLGAAFAADAWLRERSGPGPR